MDYWNDTWVLVKHHLFIKHIRVSAGVSALMREPSLGYEKWLWLFCAANKFYNKDCREKLFEKINRFFHALGNICKFD
jgi:hypothetical protein